MTPPRKRAVVCGHATLDYVLNTESGGGPLSGTCLAHIHADAWPRPGGAVLYAARRLAAAGHHVAPLAEVGDDRHGADYLSQCAQAGIDTAGLAMRPGGRTPVCVLAYHRDGSHTCLLDPGRTYFPGFDAARRALIDAADLIVVTAGLPEAAHELLRLRRPAQRLAWIAKHDDACFPAGLRQVLARQADAIFCNRSERAGFDAFLPREAAPPPLIVQTDAERGVLVERGGSTHRLAVEPLRATDATGAGDTLAGETLARLLAGETDPLRAVQAGIAAAGAMLRERHEAGHKSP